MPNLNSILEMFGQTPIRPLHTHLIKASHCVENLIPFFEAVLKEDWDAANKKHQEIVTLENEADSLKRDLKIHLPKSLFASLPRPELLDLLSLQDGLANRAKDIAGLVLGRHMAFPTQIASLYFDFLKRCIDTVKQAKHALAELDAQLETGFRGNETKIVETMIWELDRIENETDKQQIKIRQQLFQIEKQLYPVDVIFLYKILDWTGDLADTAHRVGGRLHSLVAR